jgi:hypothetical protein
MFGSYRVPRRGPVRELPPSPDRCQVRHRTTALSLPPIARVIEMCLSLARRPNTPFDQILPPPTFRPRCCETSHSEPGRRDHARGQSPTSWPAPLSRPRSPATTASACLKLRQQIEIDPDVIRYSQNERPSLDRCRTRHRLRASLSKPRLWRAAGALRQGAQSLHCPGGGPRVALVMQAGGGY